VNDEPRGLTLRRLLRELEDEIQQKPELKRVAALAGRWLLEAAGSDRGPSSSLDRPQRSSDDQYEERDQRVPSLDVVRSRCKLKSEACAWAIQRRMLEAQGANHQEDITPRDRVFLDKARELPECYMWMLDPYGPDALDEDLARIRGCYINLVTSIDLIRDAIKDGDREIVTDATRMFAEAQSAVRAGAIRAGLRYERDQQDAFDWLRDHTYREQIYVPRYMRLNDPADPDAWEDLQSRLGELRERLEGDRESTRHRRELLARADYHARRLAEEDGGDANDWERLFDAMARLVEDGLPTDDSTLRELLIPIIDDVPEELEIPENAEKILDEVEEYLEELEEEDKPSLVRNEQG